MLLPLGPVAIFGASNFPFAFSTAGGDTASALAAGCPVIFKAHPSHLGTNELIATAIKEAAIACQMPDGVFSFLIGEGPVTGLQLVKDPVVQAVGFTGSYFAGISLFKAAINERSTPIPVYAEMSSINPVVILPGMIAKNPDKTAAMLAASITLGVGQFCTNPGLLFLIKDQNTDAFITALSTRLEKVAPSTMLNKNICNSYYQNRQVIADQMGVKIQTMGSDYSETTKGSSALMTVSANDFIQNSELQNEMFGPASLIVLCNNKEELSNIIQKLQGQLTGTILCEPEDLMSFEVIIDVLKEKVGRLIFNSMPTGVEVCYAMVHGGPFPATTDSKHTSVGGDSIKRFVRPVCWQDCPEQLLPNALKNSNPLHIFRKVNGLITNEPIV